MNIDNAYINLKSEYILYKKNNKMINIESDKYFIWLQKSINIWDIVNIFNNLLTVAVNLSASDIHIEPYENFCRIRVRIDGIMENLTQYPRNLHENLISKFKIESGQMKPDEKRLPQDARVSNSTLDGKQIDLRANTLPTVWWEKLVMRIVDKSKKIMSFEELWIEWTILQTLKENLNYPNGIILTTWPTWSGKTNTLYACLSSLNQTNVNITTYEDPVESRIEWLNQAQIRTDIDFTFAKWLRWSLRQDPDIVMVGEIRDRDTLESAMEAAMTWHLVFSTIHTNSSAETITRAMNLGAKAYQITGTISLVIAQRLVRRINWDNMIDIIDISWHSHFDDVINVLDNIWKDKLNNELLVRNIPQNIYEDFAKWIINKPKWFESGNNTNINYKWRVWIYEFMEYDNNVKNMLLQNKTAYEIEFELMKSGKMINLEMDGIFKVMKWLTTLDELYRIIKHYKF